MGNGARNTASVEREDARLDSRRRMAAVKQEWQTFPAGGPLLCFKYCRPILPLQAVGLVGGASLPGWAERRVAAGWVGPGGFRKSPFCAGHTSRPGTPPFAGVRLIQGIFAQLSGSFNRTGTALPRGGEALSSALHISRAGLAGTFGSCANWPGTGPRHKSSMSGTMPSRAKNHVHERPMSANGDGPGHSANSQRHGTQPVRRRNAVAWGGARESESRLWVAGRRVKKFRPISLRLPP